MLQLSAAMTVCHALVIILIAVALSQVTITQTDNIIRENIGTLSSELNAQMKMNVENYLTRCESTATLVFAEEENYTYDATDPSNDPYEALNTEARISEDLFDLCIMENFVDFGIVYSNNHVVGKISHGTKDKMGDLIYNDLSAMISRSSTQDGWYSGFNNDYKRIYYVKRLNDNAVLAVSVYSVELENVVETPDTMNSMAVRLVDKEMNIIYSSLAEDSSILPREICDRIKGNNVDPNKAEYIVSADPCGDDWILVTSIPTQYIFDAKTESQERIITIAAIAGLIAIIIDVAISLIFANPINHLVSTLGMKADYDQLTGLLNKNSFEDNARYRIANARKTVHAMMIVDIDDFKSINDTLGHKTGDKVLADMGKLLREQFGEKDLTGRIGGDEFCTFVKLDSYENAWAGLLEKCETVRKKFGSMYADENKTHRLSCSIGAALFPFDADTFEELYINADKALYSSKRGGKDSVSLYGEKSSVPDNAEKPADAAVSRDDTAEEGEH
ncbi:MAG: GGDEF domain-containing protein [Oscillospiraceae bacterium]|nr:GGDEF domain-containing protein [Oscillospiraceae bacterium]